MSSQLIKNILLFFRHKYQITGHIILLCYFSDNSAFLSINIYRFTSDDSLSLYFYLKEMCNDYKLYLKKTYFFATMAQTFDI